MAVSIDPTETMTELWDADSDASPSWDGLTVTEFAGFQREGANCLGVTVSTATVQGSTTVTAFDATANRIYIWILPRGEMDILANGGVRIVAGDGTNRAAYYVGGSDYVSAFTVNGWACYVLDANNLPTGFATIDGTEASINWAAITDVGVGFKTLAKSLGGIDNCFFDIARYGTGLNIKGGSSGDPGIWAEIAADDTLTTAGKAYGIVMEYQPGVYGVQGDITFGDSDGTTTTYFKDENAIVVFLDTGALAYNMDIVGNATGTNTFIDGVIVGSGDTAKGRSGSIYQSAGPALTMDFTDTDLDVLTLYGSKFQGVSAGVSFGVDTTHVLAGVTFSQSGQIVLASVNARNCTFSETTSTVASLLWNESINIQNSTFIANTIGAGVEHPSDVGTPYTYFSLTFSGNTYAVNNTSGQTITISLSGTSDAGTYTGTLVNFDATVPITFTVLDEDDVAIQYARINIVNATTKVELYQIETNASGIATQSHTFGGELAIEGWVRQFDIVGADYVPQDFKGTIKSTGFDANITLIEII